MSPELEPAGGTASANDATTIATNDIGTLEDLLKAARSDYEQGASARRIAAAETKVEKAEDALAAAKEGLAIVKREEKERAAEDAAAREAKAAALAAKEGV